MVPSTRAARPTGNTMLDTLLKVALQGKGAMPPKGGNASLSKDEVHAAIEYMVSHSK